MSFVAGTRQGRSTQEIRILAELSCSDTTGLLWLLILGTFLENMWTMEGPIHEPSDQTIRMVTRTLAAGTTIAAAFFKVAFAKADSPELLGGFEQYIPQFMLETGLVMQARTVFLGIGILGCVLVGQYYLEESKSDIAKRSMTARDASCGQKLILQNLRHLFTVFSLSS